MMVGSTSIVPSQCPLCILQVLVSEITVSICAPSLWLVQSPKVMSVVVGRLGLRLIVFQASTSVCPGYTDEGSP